MSKLKAGEYVFDIKRDAFVTGIVVLFSLVKLMKAGEIGMPEALIYISIAVVIAGYWTFSAWLRIREKSAEGLLEAISQVKTKLQTVEDAQDDTEEALATMTTKLNAITLRLGLSQ